MKQIVNILAFLISINILLAQSPQKMSYQVVIRNSSNQLLANTQVGMRISILQGTITGNSVYTETQTPTTNANGLATLQVGTGTVVSGSITVINWGAGPFFLKSETDPSGGSNYSITGASQLLSVPYALYAEKSGPAGANIGDMLYWDGSKWTVIPVAKDNVQLTLCGGVPTWGNCVSFSTNPVTSVTTTSAVSGVTITSIEGGMNSAGICYGTFPRPTTQNNASGNGYNTPGNYPFPLSNLMPNTTYYVRAYTTNSLGTSYGNEISFTTIGNQFAVGQSYGGGIIFYIDGTGQHGLIADSSRVKTTNPTYPWGCQGTAIKADSIFGSGQANTTAIVAGCAASTAAKYANDLVLNGFSDWFLPSTDELKKLVYPNILGFPGNTTYWTSSQLNSITGNAIFISAGGNGYGSKTDSKNAVYQARAIRKF